MPGVGTTQRQVAMPGFSLQTILCPVDFSEYSAAALRYAAALARCTQARLVALHAHSFQPPVYFTEGQLEELLEQWQRSLRPLEDQLRSFVREHAALEAEVFVKEGRPAELILEMATKVGADLIAMGTHGRTGLRRFLLGSIAEEVLHGSRIPVMLIRPRPGQPQATQPQVRQILCPVNETEAARRSLEWASWLAQCAGATLTVLHVEEPHRTGRIEDLCAWIPAEHRAQCQIREMTRRGDVREQVVQAAEELGVDLLVIGASHRRLGDQTVIGSTTPAVVRSVRCPVVVVPAGDSEPV